MSDEKKPAPGPLLHVAKLLDIGPESMVMVGDGPNDVECARRARVRSVAVESVFGLHDRLADAHPDVIVRSLSELPEIIRRWRDSTARLNAVPSIRSAGGEVDPEGRG